LAEHCAEATPVGLERAPAEDAEKPSLAEEEASKGDRDREDEVTLDDGSEDLLAQPLGEEQGPLLLAGGTESVLPGIGRRVGCRITGESAVVVGRKRGVS